MEYAELSQNKGREATHFHEAKSSQTKVSSVLQKITVIFVSVFFALRISRHVEVRSRDLGLQALRQNVSILCLLLIFLIFFSPFVSSTVQ